MSEDRPSTLTDPRDQVEFPLGLEVFVSLEAFYAADERRRLSGEADYGIFWWDGKQGYSDTWRISAVRETGEIYALLEQRYRRGRPTHPLVVLGAVAFEGSAYETPDAILQGWNLKCGESFSLQWVIDRVLSATGEASAPVSVLCRTHPMGDHVHVDVFVGRQPGSRGRAGELILRADEWEVVRAAFEQGFGDRLELVEREVPPGVHDRP